MDLFKSQISYIESLEQTFYNSLQESIRKFDFVIKDYIVNKQLFRQGVDGAGKKLEGYTRTTIRMKIATGRPADRTTLYQEGDFHASVNIDAFDDRFEISSNVDYAKYLVKRYGPNILKPSSENLQDFLEKYFFPTLKTNINGQFTK